MINKQASEYDLLDNGETMLKPASGKKDHSQFKVLMMYLPVLLAILIMLPRLFSPNFGLFDDGKSIITAQRLAGGDWSFQFDATDARYRPLYWLSFAAIYNLFGGTPFPLFVVNMLALSTTTGLLIALLRRLGAKPIQAGLAGLLFVISGPIIENYYTLSKGEWLQLLFISISMLAATSYNGKSPLWRKVVLTLFVSSALVCASLSKETSLILLPVGVVWFLADWLWNRRIKSGRFGWSGLYLVANILGSGFYLLLRSFSTSKAVSVQGYTSNYSFSVAQMVASAVRWTGWLIRDFIWAAPIVGLAIIFILLRRRLTSSGVLLFGAFIWMGAWICIYLPWTYMAEYYMLPFTLGFAVFTSTCAFEIIPALSERGWRRGLTIGIMGLSALLLIGSMLDNLTNARVQLAMDSANTEMMNYLVKNTPPNSTVYVNIQDPNEYFDEIQYQMGLADVRPDLQVLPFQPDINLNVKGRALFILSPDVENQPLLTVRMGVIEATQKMWNISLHDILPSSPGSQVVFETIKSFRLSDVNYPRLFCSLIKTRSFCALPVPVVDLRVFSYGWQVTRVVKP
jgi:hypothetical protein